MKTAKAAGEIGLDPYANWKGNKADLTGLPKQINTETEPLKDFDKKKMGGGAWWWARQQKGHPELERKKQGL